MRLLFVFALSSLAISGLLADPVPEGKLAEALPISVPADSKARALGAPVPAVAKSTPLGAAEAKKANAYQPAQARDGAHHHDHDHDEGHGAYNSQPQVPAYQPQPQHPAPQQYNAPAVQAYPQAPPQQYAPQQYAPQQAQPVYSPPAPQYNAAPAAYPAEAPVYGAGPAASHQPESYAPAPQQYAPAGGEAQYAPAEHQSAPSYGGQQSYAPAPTYSAPSHPGYYYYYYPVQDSGKKKFQWPKIKWPKIPEIGGYGTEYKGLIGVGLAAIILLIVFGGTLLALPIIGIGRRSLESVWESEYLSKDNLNHMASLVLNAIDKYQTSIAEEKLE